VIIGRATLADLDAIAALEQEGFEASRWSADGWRAEIEGADRHVLVARDDEGEVLGVATFQVVCDVADLHRVVVRADRRGQGIGRRLLRAGIDWARASGADRVLLEVEVDNAPARGLYESLSFRVLARRDDYYAEGQHALVMALDVASQQGRSA